MASKVRTLSVLFAAGLMAALPVFADAGEPNPETKIGKQIEDFTLPDQDGKELSLSDFADKKAKVIIFVGTECPISNRYLPYLNDMAKAYKDEAIFLGVNSLTFNTPEMIAKHYKDYDIQFPVLHDAHQSVLLQLDAERTPQCFVLDKDNVVRYVGRVDDRTGYTYKRNDPKRHDLDAAIAEVIEGKEVTEPKTEVMGCIIVRDESVHEKTGE